LNQNCWETPLKILFQQYHLTTENAPVAFPESARPPSQASNRHARPNAQKIRTEARKVIPTITAMPMPASSAATSRGIASGDVAETCCCMTELHRKLRLELSTPIPDQQV